MGRGRTDYVLEIGSLFGDALIVEFRGPRCEFERELRDSGEDIRWCNLAFFDTTVEVASCRLYWFLEAFVLD